jgi:hypothetical protein
MAFKLQQQPYTNTHLTVLTLACHLLSVWLSMLPVLNLLNTCVRYDRIRKPLAPTLPTRSSETLSDSCTAGAVSGPDSTRAYACLAGVRRFPSPFSIPCSSSPKIQRRPQYLSASFSLSCCLYYVIDGLSRSQIRLPCRGGLVITDAIHYRSEACRKNFCARVTSE